MARYSSVARKGTIYRALPGAAQADAWIQGSAAGLTNVFGILADDKTNTLWVCANATGGFGRPSTGQTALRSFDLKTGTAKQTYPFPDGGLCNDVALADDGTAYTCDTMGGRVLRLKPGAASLDIWASDPQLRGIDGLSLLADENLYVNNFFTGKMLRIPVSREGTPGSIVAIQTSMPFSRPDGLRTSGANTLLQAEGQGRLTEITINGDRGDVRVVKDGLPGAAAVTQIGKTTFILVSQLKAVVVSATTANAQTTAQNSGAGIPPKP